MARASRRWASNTVAFAGSLVAALAASAVLTWWIDNAPGVQEALAERPLDGDGDAAWVEPSPLELTFAAVAALDIKVKDVQASTALDRAICGSLPAEPIMTMSMVLDDPSATQALVMAMPPGGGTWVAEEIVAGLPQCMGASTVGEALEWMPVWGSTSTAYDTQTTVWSRGDIVVVTAGSFEAAHELDLTLTEALDAQRCVNVAPLASARFHNPLLVGADNYVAPTRAHRVTVDPPQPQEEDGAVLPTPVASDVPDPGQTVVPPQVPHGRTYWPELPEPVERPSLTLPGAPPADSADVRLLVRDPYGPGCGWKFSGYRAVETRDSTEEETRAIVDDAERALLGAWAAWVMSVEQFWDEHDAYVEAVERYEAYRADVEATRSYWINHVAPLWDEYERLVRLREEAIEEVAQWGLQRAEARDEWNAFLDICVSEPAPDTGSDTSAPPVGVDPSPQPSPQPSPSAPLCSSRTEPPILSADAPQVPEAPEPPVPSGAQSGT